MEMLSFGTGVPCYMDPSYCESCSKRVVLLVTGVPMYDKNRYHISRTSTGTTKRRFLLEFQFAGRPK